MRAASYRYRVIVATILTGMSGWAAPAAAQGPGGFDAVPSSLFGTKKEPSANVSGPSLSATDEPVAEIRVVGNRTMPTPRILNELQTRVGRPFDPALVQSDVRKLASRSWFVDVRANHEASPAGRVVIFTVVERPVIRYIQYLGNKGIRERKLAAETGLKVGGSVDPHEVEESRRKLLSLYQRNGFNNTQITVLEGSKPTDQGVVFVINEGQAQKIWKVEFEGNSFATDGQLRTKVESKRPLMLIFKGFVDREVIDADVDRVTAYYRSFGFFDAKVGRVYEFNEKGNWLTLRFVIHEGRRYEVDRVSFMGNRIFASDSLAMGIKLPAGNPFEQAKMNADLAWLKELYGSQGYVFADIKAEPIFLEEPGKIDLMYHIEEGRQWRVGNIYVHIAGENPHTRIQTALNRITVRPGEIADMREIKSSERRLQASGLFLADPMRGVMPKITYRIQELGDTELATGGSSVRGQSPDGARQSLFGLQPAATQRPRVAEAGGPPLLAPPGSSMRIDEAGQLGTAPPAPSASHTYHVRRPIDQVEGDEIELHIDLPAFAPGEPADEELSPTAIRHEVRRSPYDNLPTASPYGQPATYAASTASAPQQPAPAPYHGTHQGFRPPQIAANEQAPPVRSTYDHMVVRTQSPYQAVTTQPQPAPAQPGNFQPFGPYAPVTTDTRYGTSNYGGQAVGATGPEAVPAGYRDSAVRQVAITEPQLPPPPGAVTTPTLAQTQFGTPAFGPPPTPQPGATTVYPPGYVPPPQYGQPQPYGQPTPMPQQAGPAPHYGPAPSYAPGQMLAPDPNITPVTPLQTNPALFPRPAIDPFTQPMQDPAVDLHVDLSEGQTGRLMFGVAVNSDAGLVGQILLDEQNFDWRRYPLSMEDIVSGRAWRGAGQRFRLEAAPGTHVQRYLISFQEPYLMDTPVSLGLSGSFFDRRYRDWDEQRLGGRVSLGYQWTENDLSAALAYRGENINIRNISSPGLPELEEVRGDNVLHGFKLTIANDTRDSAFLATQGHYLELGLEQVVGTFLYPRLTADARQYFLMRERPDHTGRHVLSLSTRLGITGNNTPIYENFYAGGFSTMRGWDFRGASPVKSGVQVGGEFMWVNTIEYLFPLTADDMIHGVVFTDFGTVEESVKIKDFRAAPGFGLRVTVPAMGPAPIALDFAFPILSADGDDKQIFSFNVGLQR